MKKRYEEVCKNLARLEEQLSTEEINATIRAKQLYHDREEITIHVRRIWPEIPGRRNERD